MESGWILKWSTWMEGRLHQRWNLYKTRQAGALLQVVLILCLAGGEGGWA